MWIAAGIFSLLFFGVTGQTVTIMQGDVVGTAAEDGNYYQFYGIPFADSTSGSNRFKAPNSPPSFQDTFVADRKNIKCVHALGVGYEGVEDCLVANVFTPVLTNQARLPVMVWVKGKEFNKVNEEPSFRSFVEKDVVVVTLNYRESILGFLCLGTDTAPGNAGLKDIMAGLRWVQENIVQFGGDPNDVTLVGHGSGAAAVDLISMSPLANGLIHKAISQSGTALAPWAVSRDNVKYAIQVAEALGHVITDIQDLSEIFTRTSVPALMGVINELELTDNSLAFAPCIERENLEGVQPFMVKTPIESLQSQEFLEIPFMTGYVDNEGTIRSEKAVEGDWLEKMDESFNEFLSPDLKFDNDVDESLVAEAIRSFYFRDNLINMDNIDNYISYHGDTMILVSTLREVRLRAALSAQPVYLYQFSYKGTLGEPFVGAVSVDSAAHSEELAYMLYRTSDQQIPGNDRDLTIGDILIERWTNFAKTDLPQSETSQIFWRPFTMLTPFYLRVLDNEEINDQSAFEVLLQNPQPDIITFWDQIYARHFLDAESTWDISDRIEDEDDDDADEVQIVDSAEENGGGEADGGEEMEGGEDEDDEEDGEDDDGNSAAATVGYTFSILTLFAILNHFHSTQIMS